MALDRGDGVEEAEGLLDRHVEHLGDRLALVVDLQRLPVVAGAVAHLAGDVDVGQEVHLDLDGAVAGARLAAPALDVEAEAPGLVAAHLGLGRGREQLAHVVEDAGVGGRVGARGAADRRLVDVDDLVDLVHAVDPRVAARHRARPVELLGQGVVEDVVDQRRLARPRHAGDGGEHPQRELDVDALEVVLACALDRDLPLLVALAALGGDRDAPAPRQVGPRQGLLAGQEVLDGAGDDDLAAVLARAGPDVDHPVGRRDRVLVVLDHDQRVAHVAQPDQRVEQAHVVALVQADGRLVEHVEDADQAGADLRGQPDALGLATGQGGGGAVHGQVVEADVEQEAHAGVDLLDHPLGDVHVAVGQLERGQELGALADRHGRDLGDRLPGHRHRQGDRLEPGPLAGRARDLAHVAFEPLTGRVALGLGVPALHPRDDPVEGGVVGTLAPVAVAVADVDLLVVAVQQRLLRLLRQSLPRGLQREPDRVAERLDQPGEVFAGVAAGPRVDRAVAELALGVGHHQIGVDLHLGAQTGALRAGAERRVEGERARLHLLERQVVVGAVEVLGVEALAVGVVFGQVDELQRDRAAGQLQCRLDRVGEPAPRRVLHRQAVDDDLDVVLLVLLQRRRLFQPHDGAVDPGPGEALGLQLAEQLGVFALAAPDDRREHLEPGALLQVHHAVDDLLRHLPGDRARAHRAVGLADARPQQPQVVVDLGDRADGRARVFAGGLLVDGDRGRQALDEVDVGLVHLAEELAGVGRQRLDIAPLALSEDRVEGQARLARAGQAGKDDQRVPRQIQRDVLEVVFSCTTHDQAVCHGDPGSRKADRSNGRW